MINPSDLERFEKYVMPEPNTGCWLWAGSTNQHGYGRFAKVTGDGWVLAHRASWMLHHSNDPGEQLVLHKCDVRCCVNPDHLYISNQRDNMRDRWERNPVPTAPGAKNGRAKLTEQQVRAIRNDPRSALQLERVFGVSNVQISKIRRGEAWASVK